MPPGGLTLTSSCDSFLFLQEPAPTSSIADGTSMAMETVTRWSFSRIMIMGFRILRSRIAGGALPNERFVSFGKWGWRPLKVSKSRLGGDEVVDCSFRPRIRLWGCSL